MRYSVVIPTLNAGDTLVLSIQSVRKSFKDAEIIVVDGGSSDQTAMRAKFLADKFIISDKGRGVQMNQGVAAATGDIFIFLHADTVLPPEAQSILKDNFINTQVQIGTFGMRFDRQHWLLDFYGKLTKIDSLWTRFGDQCIVVRRSFFNDLSGFPNWPLFEDVRFLQEARRKAKIHSFSANVVTSSSKFFKNGVIKQQIKNGWLIFLYLLGVSPNALFEKYSS